MESKTFNAFALAFARFHAIKLIEPSLKGLCVFDKLNRNANPDDPVPVLYWNKRELENYFCTPEILIRWAEKQSGSLFTSNYADIISSCISGLTPPIYLQNKNDNWWNDQKLGDWAEEIFREFFKRINEPMTMRKGNFHELIDLMKIEEIDQEVIEKLNAIYILIKD